MDLTGCALTMKTKYLITLLTLFSLLLTSCMADTPEPSPSTTASTTTVPTFMGPGYRVTGIPEPPSPTVASTTTAAALLGPGYRPGIPEPPSPTADPGYMASTPEPLSSTITSTTTVATSTAPGWTRYDSINHIRDPACVPNNTDRRPPHCLGTATRP